MISLAVSRDVSCAYRVGLRLFFFFQAEDGIRDLVRSRGLGDVYKRQTVHSGAASVNAEDATGGAVCGGDCLALGDVPLTTCLLYTSDAADERSSGDLGGRRIIKKRTMTEHQSGEPPRICDVKTAHPERS